MLVSLVDDQSRPGGRDEVAIGRDESEAVLPEYSAAVGNASLPIMSSFGKYLTAT